MEIELIDFDGTDVLLVPWQVDNEAFRNKVISKNLHTKVCMGHLEIQGFKFNNKSVCDHGLHGDTFLDNFELVFSGHFHTRSEQTRQGKKIQYIGNAYHLSRHDIGDERGFCILDTDTLKYKFVNTKKTIKYVKIAFPEKITKHKIHGNVVDVYIKYDKDRDESLFDNYIKEIEDFEPAFPVEIKIINPDMESTIDDLKIQDTMNMIQEYVKTKDIDNQKTVFNKMNELYEQCKAKV